MIASTAALARHGRANGYAVAAVNDTRRRREVAAKIGIGLPRKLAPHTSPDDRPNAEHRSRARAPTARPGRPRDAR